jgi:glycogen synthase
MRILVITNFYPPYAIGGMEYRCQETINLLRKRGHKVIVLTSTYGVSPQGVVDGMEYRLLALESDLMHYQPLRFFLNWWQEEKHNLRTFEHVLHKFKPDLVFIWGMWNLSHHLPYYAEQVWRGPVVYSLANDWPAQPSIHESYWHLPARHRLLKPLKQLTGNLALNYLNLRCKNIVLQFNHVICASHTLQEQLLKAGVQLQDAPVIYPGIDLKQFSTNGLQGEDPSALRLSLLYAGSLVEHKGVHTAIEAMGHLSKEELDLNLNLTIVGSGHKLYEIHLHNLVNKYGLQNKVYFVEQIARAEMPNLMHRHNILIFPSIWEEPFSRVVLEAMASGLVVIGTETGGTKEILKHGETGLSFSPGDAGALAGCVKQLIDKPELRAKLSKNGRELVERQFDIHRMVDEIESYLEDVIKPSSAIPGSVRPTEESLMAS